MQQYTDIQPFCGHYTSKPASAVIPVKNWRILLKQSFIVRMPLLMAASTIRMGDDARVLLNGILNSITWTVFAPYHINRA